jgi:hypothetical protein
MEIEIMTPEGTAEITGYVVVLPFAKEGRTFQYVLRYTGQMHDVSVEWYTEEPAFGGFVNDPTDVFGEEAMAKLLAAAESILTEKGWISELH